MELEILDEDQKKKPFEQELKPMSMNEFHEMIDQAKQEKESGCVISHQDLKKKVKSWI